MKKPNDANTQLSIYHRILMTSTTGKWGYTISLLLPRFLPSHSFFPLTFLLPRVLPSLSFFPHKALLLPRIYLASHFSHTSLSFCLGFYLATLSFHSSLSLLHRSFYYVFDLSGLSILPKFSPSGFLFTQNNTKDHISKWAYTIQITMRYNSLPHTWSTLSPKHVKGQSQKI